MSIERALANAYRAAIDRNWDKIYWCIDLHGTCLTSNYNSDEFEFINDDVISALRLINDRKSSVIILWSSCYPEDQIKIVQLFEHYGISVDFFNENPLVSNTKTGDFSKKFYMSILIDDKAGFDPNTDWNKVINFLNKTTDIV